MSTDTTKFLHGDLMVLARWFLAEVLKQPGDIVGSLRRCSDCARIGTPKGQGSARCRRESKDLDIICEMPNQFDGLYTALVKIVDIHEDAAQPTLGFGPNKRSSFVIAHEGLKSGFRACKLSIDLARAERAMPNFPRESLSVDYIAGPNMMMLPVQFFRYDAGAEGNKGWIQLIRTGPNTDRDPFGQACLARWKDISRGGKSDKGYPHGHDGRKYPVPDEAAAFDLLQMRPLAPHERTATAVPGWRI